MSDIKVTPEAEDNIASAKRVGEMEAKGEDSGDFYQEAVDWVVNIVPDQTHCPFCGWRTAMETGGAFKKHVRMKHPAHVSFAYQYKDLDGFFLAKKKEAIAQDNNVDPEEYDLETVDDPGYDYLWIPKELRKEMKARGADARWVRKDNIGRYKERGMKLVKRTTDMKMPNQFSEEDSTVQTRELVLMERPRDFIEKSNRMKRMRIQQKLAPRMEEMSSTLSDKPKMVYDAARKAGASEGMAMKYAKAAESGGITVSKGGHLFMRD